jgi:hypothetical protein
MERQDKHVSEKTNSSNNRRAVFSLPSVPRGYKKNKDDRLNKSSSGVSSEGSVVIRRTERVSGDGSRKELGREKKTSCVPQ